MQLISCKFASTERQTLSAPAPSSIPPSAGSSHSDCSQQQFSCRFSAPVQTALRHAPESRQSHSQSAYQSSAVLLPRSTLLPLSAVRHKASRLPCGILPESCPDFSPNPPPLHNTPCKCLSPAKRHPAAPCSSQPLSAFSAAASAASPVSHTPRHPSPSAWIFQNRRLQCLARRTPHTVHLADIHINISVDIRLQIRQNKGRCAHLADVFLSFIGSIGELPAGSTILPLTKTLLPPLSQSCKEIGSPSFTRSIRKSAACVYPFRRSFSAHPATPSQRCGKPHHFC